MKEQEQEHLETFNKLIVEKRVRPTALLPVWNVAGFALGMNISNFTFPRVLSEMSYELMVLQSSINTYLPKVFSYCFQISGIYCKL